MQVKFLFVLLLSALCFGFVSEHKVEEATSSSDASNLTEGIESTSDDRSTLFKVDSEHSNVLFRVLHMGSGPFWGRFNKVGGSFMLNPKAKIGNFVRVEIDASSIDSNSAGRNRHLKGQDFFAVKEFPKISFESTKVVATGDDFEIEGTLKLRGKKKSVKFKAKHFGTANIHPRFGLRSGYEAELTIKRSDFGVNYGLKGKMLGDDVKLIIALEGMTAK